MLLQDWLSKSRNRLLSRRWTRRGSKRKSAACVMTMAAETFEVRKYPAATAIAAVAQPSDKFVDATVLAGTTVTATGANTNATKEIGEPDHDGKQGGHSVWWQWTATSSGSVTINTSGSSFDTLLAVYTGTSVGQLRRIGSNDDVNYPSDPTSKVTFNAVAGTTYRIAVDGYSGAVGNITLHLQASNVIPNPNPTTPTATLVNGVLTIQGTRSADQISVQQINNQISIVGAQIRVNGVLVNQVDVSQVQRIVVNGLEGNDQIRMVGAGADGIQDITIPVSLSGGAGDDMLYGGAGNDVLDGGLGNDLLDGGLGIDRVYASSNANFTLTNAQLQGQGTDSLANVEQAQLIGGTSANRLDASGFSGSVTLNGGSGNDVLLGGGADDVLTGGVGNDVITGGGGTDTLVESANANMLLTNAKLTGVGIDTLVSIEQAQLTGGTSNNTLNASGFSGSVTLDGGAGNDILNGGNLADSLFGGAGNDQLHGNGGNDVIEGDTGDDLLNGGDGDDRFVFRGNLNLGQDAIAASDTLGTNTLDFSGLGTALTQLKLGQTSLQSASSNLSLTIRNTDAIDIVFGTEFNDLISGNDQNNSLHGGSGNDTLLGQGGDDQVNGGNGNDHLNGGTGDDSMSGEAGNDVLIALDNTATDSLDGGAGHDTNWIDQNGDTNDEVTDDFGDDKVQEITEFANGADRSLDGDRIADPLVEQGVIYKTFSNNPLFAQSGPRLTDIRQGAVGDCWLLAGLAAVAKDSPNAILENVVDFDDGTFGVVLGGQFYRVDNDLPVRPGQSRPIFAGLGFENSMWVAIVEKAYTHYRSGENSYESIEGGWGVEVNRAFGSAETGEQDVESYADATELANDIAARCDRNESVTVASFWSIPNDSPLVGGHMYTVMSVIRSADGVVTGIVLRNPWGFDGQQSRDSNPYDGLVTVTPQQLYDLGWAVNWGRV